MIKVIIFDADGVMINGNRRFSNLLAEEYGISTELTLLFFDGPFQDCLIGQADLRETITPYLSAWGWDKGVDEFLDYWFKSEHHINEELFDYIKILKQEGIQCFLATNNEKYRFQYILEKMEFANIFDKTYASAHLGHKKPNQEFFSKIFKELNGIQKNEILFIDDSAENIQAAKDFSIYAEIYTTFDNLKQKIEQYLA